MTDREPCHVLVKRTGHADTVCLEGAAAHIAHDLHLLQHAWDGREWRIGWTLWFITARVLIDFFFVYERRKNSHGEYYDDILAADFLPAGVWKGRAQELESVQPPDFGACRIVANKLAAHLTYSRVEFPATARIEPSEAVHRHLLGTMGMWLDALVPDRRAWFDPWFPRP